MSPGGPRWSPLVTIRGPQAVAVFRRAAEAEQELLVAVIVEPVEQPALTVMPVAGGGHEADREPGGRCVEPCRLEDGDHLVDVVQLGQMQLLGIGAMPLGHQRAGGVDTHDRLVHAPGHEGTEHRPGVRSEVVKQVEHLVAERRVKAAPPGGQRVGGLEPERPPPGEPPGVLDRPRGRVIAESLGDGAPIGEQPQEPARLQPASRTRRPARSMASVSTIALQMNACSCCIASSAAASRQQVWLIAITLRHRDEMDPLGVGYGIHR